MVEKLQQLLQNSYSPYSNFKVSSIVVMKDGTMFSGVNVEDASFHAGICAERNAITTAIANGYKKGDFQEIYVMVDNSEISTCCFVCRQLILEFFDKQAKITCMNKNGEKRVFTVAELCPFPFSEEDLK